jgi:hypothetical protein
MRRKETLRTPPTIRDIHHHSGADTRINHLYRSERSGGCVSGALCPHEAPHNQLIRAPVFSTGNPGYDPPPIG